MNPKDREETTHESYGLVQFSRVSSHPPKRFFGSSVRASYYIEMTVHKARRSADGSYVNYFADETILNLRLSPNQFAELLTTMNIGSGVPCTLQRVGNETMEELLEEENPRELHKKDFRREVREATKEIREAIVDTAKALETSSASFGIGKRKELLKKLEHVLMRLEKNVPFYHETFDKAIDKTIGEAKAEIDAFTTGVVTQLGLDSLQTLKAIQDAKPKFELEHEEENS